MQSTSGITEKRRSQNLNRKHAFTVAVAALAMATVAQAAEETYTVDTNHTHATFAF